MVLGKAHANGGTFWERLADLPRVLMDDFTEIVSTGETDATRIVTNTENDLRDVAGDGLREAGSVVRGGQQMIGSVAGSAVKEVGGALNTLSWLPLVLVGGLVVVLINGNSAGNISAIGAAVRR